MKFTEYITEVTQQEIEKFGVIKAIEKLAQPFIKEFRNTGSNKLIWRGTSKKIPKNIKQIIPRKNRIPVDMDQEFQEHLDNLFQSDFGWRARSEGVFTTSNKIVANAYGDDVAIFIPIGNYKYLFNRDVQDLYTEIQGIEAQVSSEQDWESDWEEQYGEYSGKGSWFYMDVDLETSDKEEAYELAAEAEGIDRSDFDESVDDLNWEPEMTLDDYEQERRDSEEEIKEIVMQQFGNLVDNYQSTNLKQGLNSGVEITFKPKSYLIIDKKFEKVILQYMKTGKVPYDKKQMELAFEKDPKMRKNVGKILKFSGVDTSMFFTSSVANTKKYKLQKRVGAKWNQPIDKPIKWPKKKI